MQVPSNVKQAYKDMLVTELQKESIVRKIGRMGESQEDVVSQELQSCRKQLPIPNSWAYEEIYQSWSPPIDTWELL